MFCYYEKIKKGLYCVLTSEKKTFQVDTFHIKIIQVKL